VSTTEFHPDELAALERKRSIPRFLFVPAGLFTFWFLAHPWPVEHWAVTAFWVAATSFVLLCWTSCFHETAHQTLTTSRRTSIVLGRVLGCVMGVPYTVYRESHIRHHAYLNQPGDWELWPYSDPGVPLWFRRAFVWLDLLAGAVVAPVVYGRIFFHRDSPLKAPALRRTVAREYVGCAAFWGAILAGVQVCHAWRSFALVWCLPHAVTGVWQSTRKLTEHLGMASYDPLLGTRTVLGANPVTRLCTYLNFDIFVHGPHHRHPRAAHDLLAQRMRDYLRSHPEHDFPVYPTYLSAVRAMLPSLWRTPGCGMNAGAPPPDADRDRDVRNFVGDVNREALGRRDALVGIP
jgi:fatty acid desaturase